jgi:predicted nucleotide-binding protein (sugar kinase/HSP70/actin superfamily)
VIPGPARRILNLMGGDAAPASDGDRVGSPHKKVLIPYMADHEVAIAGALRHHGIPCEILPPPDEETLAIGLDLCRGRECLPCFLATGDMIRACRHGHVDPAHDAFLMPASPGPCRFGQYRVLQRALLDREGFAAVEIFSPTSENSYRGFGERPRALRLLVWNGVVAVDLLLKLRYEFRPYEQEAGATDAAYARGLEVIRAATEAGGRGHLVEAMDVIAADFAGLPVDRSTPRPIVAVLGEIYVMLNAHSNQELIRMLEAAGAEVVTGTLTEWFHFADETKLDRDVLFGSWRSFAGTKALSLYQERTEARLFSRVAHLLRHPADPPMRELFDMARPYFDPLLGTEALLTMAKVVAYAKEGISGVVNVMPFSCMPGIVVSGIASRLRRDLDQLPWLDINFDGQRITNIRTRLEAFLHQVAQFARSRGRPGCARERDLRG